MVNIQSNIYNLKYTSLYIHFLILSDQLTSLVIHLLREPIQRSRLQLPKILPYLPQRLLVPSQWLSLFIPPLHIVREHRIHQQRVLVRGEEVPDRAITPQLEQNLDHLVA